MGLHEEKLLLLGRKVTSTALANQSLTSKFEKAKKALSAKCECRVKVRTLYHGTSVENGQMIMSEGFKIFGNVGAFGIGVNLSPNLKHTLMYASGDESCTIVCKVAIGKMHANTSCEVKGHRGSVPDHIKPRRGYDAMYGSRGMIIVVPSAARVLPVRMIIHRGSLPSPLPPT